MLKIVGIGGGSGLPVLLQGLKNLANRPGVPEPYDEQGRALDISAIVCVSDDGGSSGALRCAMGIPAVGDLRNCLVSLSGGEPALSRLFQHRFGARVPGIEIPSELTGHSLGNLIVAALYEQTGGIAEATEHTGRLLRLQGRVFPVTEAPLTLCAEFEDGVTARGETQVAGSRRRIRRIWAEPAAHEPAPGVLEAIENADAIVLGPGSLYTSVLPNLLTPGVAAAIRRSRAVKLFICNLMSQRGETDGYSASAHLRTVEQYLGKGAINVCVMNCRALKPEVAEIYSRKGAHAVLCDVSEIEKSKAVPAMADLLARGVRIRHDPIKLARVVVSLTQATQSTRETDYFEARRAA